MKKEELEYLYFVKRLSVKQIAQRSSCSENRISYWFSKFNIKKRTISEAIYLRKNTKGDPFVFKEPQRGKDFFIFGLGLGLYWGEGNKVDRYSVRLGNTDPNLIKLFLIFLDRVFGIKKEKIRFGIQVFSDMNAKKVLGFWSCHLGVNEKQFNKIIITKTRGKGSYKKKTETGVLTIYFNNIKLKKLMMREIEKLSKIY